MEVQRKLAIVEFSHVRGCSIGQSYGECDPGCGWKVVKFASEKPLSAAALAKYGIAPKTRTF
jgi:hypothetical protein